MNISVKRAPPAPSPISVAYGSIPKDSGTFTFYRNLRPGLSSHGIDLRCVSVGRHDADLWDPAFADDGCVLLEKDETDVKRQAMAFADYCASSRVDIVMGINSLPILSALPCLTRNIRVMSRCANAFDHGYKITLSCQERLARVIATTPRLKHDLVNYYGAEEGKIRLIPNGISSERFREASKRPRGGEKNIRVGFLGRLEHNQKGVLFLPDIIRGLDRNGVDFTFRIAGKGVHGKILERRLMPFVEDGRVTFAGSLPPFSVAEFLGEVDVFVFTSRFEGCPNALLEAIMAGCAPVASNIEGITDFIIRDGHDGFLCSVGDPEAFAEVISDLSRNRERLRQTAMAAAANARERFTDSRAAADYARIFKEVMRKPPPEWTPRSWSDFRVDPAFTKKWREKIPEPLKKVIKRSFFHLGLFKRYE